ncbi:MAG: hypothetical protein U1A77_25455 [Pirellulales bacterium]
MAENSPRNATLSTGSAAENGDERSLIARLGLLRQSFRWRIALSEMWQIAAVLLGLLIADFALDYLCSFTRAVRIGISLFVGVAVVLGLCRAIHRVIRGTPGVLELAHRVERRFSVLRGLLVNAVEWTHHQVPAGASRELVEATQRRASEAAVGVDFHDLIDHDWTRRQWLATGVVGLLLGVLFSTTYASPTLTVWRLRNLAWAELEYPRRTRIEFEGVHEREFVVARGGDLRVRLRVARTEPLVDTSASSSRTPAPASDPPRLEFEPQRSHTLSPVVRDSIVHSSESRYELHVRDILEPFQFRVTADDARTGWIPVRTVDPPALENLRLEVQEPAYTGGAVLPLLAGQGPYRVLRGSRLKIEGRMKQPVVVAAALTGKTRVPCSVDASDPRRFRGELGPNDWVDGLVSLSVVDRLGLDFARPPAFRIEMLEDTPPRVVAHWSGASRLVVASTRLVGRVTVEDDRQVAAVRLLARLTNAQGEELRPWTPVEVELKKTSGSTTSSAEVSLAPLEVPPGSVLTLVWEATDNDTVSGPKTGRSTERPWSIVEPGELRADWLRREKEQRQLLEQLRIDLDDWRRSLAALPAEDAARRLRDFGRLRESLVDRAQELDEVRVEIIQSGLETMNSPLIERFSQRIMTPLLRARDQESARVERLARIGLDSSQDKSLAQEELNQAQAALDQSLREVIRELSRAEGFQEAVRLIEDLRSGQRELLLDTLEAQRRRVRQLLDGEAKPEK